MRHSDVSLCRIYLLRMIKSLCTFTLTLICSLLFGQTQEATLIVSPDTFNEDESITLTFNGLNPTQWGVNELYLWSWYFKDGVQIGGPEVGNGEWNNSNEALKLTINGNGTYSFTLTPQTFYNDSGITKIGVLVKAKNGESQGAGERKTQDFLIDVGKVIMNITSHSGNIILVQANQPTNVYAVMTAKGTQEAGAFESYLDNQLIDSGNGYPTYNLSLNTSSGGTLRIQGSPFNSNETAKKEITVEVAPTVTEEVIPTGLQEGINYHADTSKATLVLNAPEKSYVYVAGSFNNYATSSTYLMKKDPNSDLFWLELNGLTPNEIYHYQYWVYDTTPAANSPAIVKTADPYSTLVLSPFDDPYIPASSYPNLPAYPTGQEREVTVLQTAQTAYNWQVPNFQKPPEEDLVVYEILIRDFDANRSFQDLIDRVAYFKNLNINAIQLMPIMEFEGNESWGYNTVFHMALDKFYGTPEKFKELVDTFHQNGIAVILDLAINHSFGRTPSVRMWMDDADADGWGGPSTENPYFNNEPKHSYNVGNDFNHQSSLTKNFTKRVIKHWIEEYKIDGFRWDLTKGFTQNCTANDEGCTGSYQADRVAVLKEYADYSWSLDHDHYVIFEHLGTDNEEKEWANYRLNEGKGIMLWGKMTESYNQLSMGHNSNNSIERMRAESRGFNGKRLIGYPESHDEERLMYKNLEYGNSTQSGHNVKNLNVALSRMSAIGAVSLLVPGPKMIWHFGELGMEQSLDTCTDGTVNDCRLDTKPQPQWTDNWLAIAQRKKIYDDWSRMNDLKQNNAVFKGDSSISPTSANNLVQRIYLWDNSLSGLKNVVILANFDVITQVVAADFPYTGTWHDLMDESTLQVTTASQSITLVPGAFKIYGNQQPILNQFTPQLLRLQLLQNPTTEHIQLILPTEDSYHYRIYTLSGQELARGTHQKSKQLTLKAPKQKGAYMVVVQNNRTQELGICKVLIE
jgi:1,4-alpha-glucan branching enzyme